MTNLNALTSNRTIEIRIENGWWQAEYVGVNDPIRIETVTLFGQASIQTAYAATVPAVDVACELMKRNPGYCVVVA